MSPKEFRDEIAEAIAEVADELLLGLQARIGHLERQVETLQESSTREVERRREVEGKLKAVSGALEAAEASASNIAGEDCRCPACLTIRGIVAYVKAIG